MTTPPNILEKLKLLIKLQQSPNLNEANNAKVMAEKLISKYDISAEELKSIEDKKPVYTESDKLFETIGLCSWKQKLALAIGRHFNCFIIQEETVPVDGPHQFSYFINGETDNFELIRITYAALSKKIEKFLHKKCRGRGPVYVSSYAEGLTEAIANNIEWGEIDLPELKSKDIPTQTVEKTPAKIDEMIKPEPEEKEKPLPNSVDVNSQSNIQDIGAYFKGLTDGKDISLQDTLELKEVNDHL